MMNRNEEQEINEAAADGESCEVDPPTYHRTVVEIVILTEDDPWDGELCDLANDITDGDCSDTSRVMTIKSNEEVTPSQMAELLKSQGSDPGFFGLNENGSPVDEESPAGQM